MGSCIVYQQHLQQYTMKKVSRDPIKKNDEELSSILSDWIENDDNILLLIDANESLPKRNEG